jgi:hypothetical protein
MKLNKLLIILALGTLIGCSNSTLRPAVSVADHPDWDAQLVKLIRSGMIAEGMSKDQVQAAWGSAGWYYTGTASHQWGESWEYPTQIVFFDQSGLVTEWRDR